MSLNESKQQLTQLLNDQDNKVIALSGKWGTGKTYLFNELVQESADESVKGALYVSLFGLTSIDQVKRKLIESVAPGAQEHPKIWEATKQAVSAGLKVLEGFHQGFGALNELNLLILAPTMLGKKVIVLDDLERKHADLGIDEVLGFIDEYTKRHGARFFLILNTDQLDTKDAWETLREKVIDQEIRLLTSPDEAFSIANGKTYSKYAGTLRQACIACELTNIRTVTRVIRAANRILGERDLDSPILARVIPSIVLFSAIHYKGIDDGPDFQYALDIGSQIWKDLASQDKHEEPTDEHKRHEKWRLLMQALGIQMCDEFEVLLVEFLESGLFDPGKLSEIIDRYTAETRMLEVRVKAKQFLDRVYWDHRTTDAQLIEEARQLPVAAGLLDPRLVTELEGVLAELPGGADIGKAILDGWIEAFRRKNHEYAEDFIPDGHIHPSVLAEFDAVKVHAQASATVVDVCMHIMANSGWGTLQEVAMRNATAADFEAAIRNIDVQRLPRFLRGMIRMRLQRENYDTHFGPATERFVEACRKISRDAASPRLAALIKREFGRTTIASELV